MRRFGRLALITVLLLWVPFVLAACGNDSAASSNNSISVAATDSAPASACPNGGVTVQTGVDANGNGILDPSEVQSTRYVCNGSNGANGQISLVSITSEPAGSNCANGGKEISAGLDTNGNGSLDPSEVYPPITSVTAQTELTASTGPMASMA